MSDQHYSRTYTCEHESFNILLTLGRIVSLLREYGMVTSGEEGLNRQYLIDGGIFYGVSMPFRIYAYHGPASNHKMESSLWCKVVVKIGNELGKYQINIKLMGPEFERQNTLAERFLISILPNLKLVEK